MSPASLHPGLLRRSLFAVGFTLVCADLCAQTPLDLAPYRAASLERWEKDIQQLEARNQVEPRKGDGILFIGSSSIRLWKEIAEGMAPYRPIQRGFGGSNWTDVAIFAERLIHPHSPRAIVFFVANDIRGQETDKRPEEIVALFGQVLDVIRARHAETPVFYIAVTPSGARFAAWPQIKAGNAAVQAFCANHPHTYFIPTESAFLDAEGKPRDELFVADRLHLSEAGYVRWAAIIKSHLDGVLGGALPVAAAGSSGP